VREHQGGTIEIVGRTGLLQPESMDNKPYLTAVPPVSRFSDASGTSRVFMSLLCRIELSWCRAPVAAKPFFTDNQTRTRGQIADRDQRPS